MSALVWGKIVFKIIIGEYRGIFVGYMLLNQDLRLLMRHYRTKFLTIYPTNTYLHK